MLDFFSFGQQNAVHLGGTQIVKTKSNHCSFDNYGNMQYIFYMTFERFSIESRNFI